ncbi:Uncharacterized conserved protein [Rhizobiales bacterium GAS191]|nr:Uncharacterized conserved protein [Rhizobiales bacterium GAS113]SEE15391.1 Uncharacterized conserved protein [Rhizobiales bacterium GAS188]SEE41882.1 Uncharacterized conserved protein [Rhizobiales bacterium GAS191]
MNARAQGQPPLPPVRPPAPSLQTQSPSSRPLPPAQTPAAKPSPAQPSEAAACLAELGASGVKAESVPAPPAPLTDCGIAAPVRLTSVGLANGATLDLPDRPVLDCEFAAVFTAYAHDLVAPLGAAMLGSQIAALGTGPGYECRGRNGVAGAKTSAHGKGIAIDLVEIVLADHRRIAVARQANATETLFLHTMRQAACGWFTTVLGPGSDAAHAEHFHFDIARHGASDTYRICE